MKIKEDFITFITKPFTEKLTWVLLLLISITFLDVYHLIEQGLYSYSIYMISDGLIISYIIVLIWQIISIWSHRASKFYAIIISILIGIGFIVDAVCIFRFDARFSEDIASIIKGTNLNEVSEFFSSQIDLRLTLSIALSLLLLFFVFLMRTFIKIKSNSFSKAISLVTILIICGLSLHNLASFKETIIGKYYSFFSIPNPPDLNLYRTNPNLDTLNTKLPDNLVIVIGESFPKSHSSLYSYDKETNPRLKSLANDTSLIVFDNVVSPETHTIASFKAIMSTYDTPLSKNKDWYECTTLIEVIQKLGYKVTWLSNQSKVGMHENVVGEYANLCNKQLFSGDKFSGSLRGTVLDEELLPLLKQEIIANKASDRNCYIIHMMGSHYVFEQRYPKEFGKFKEDNYLDYPKSQRYNRATLDNSILYNDSIINEFIHLFEDKESFLIYFPDHGLDVYESSDHYCAHGKPDNLVSREAGIAIPLMIYLSPLYRQNFEEETRIVQSSVHHAFNTTNLIFSVLDILGVKDMEGNNIETYSLFYTKL